MDQNRFQVNSHRLVMTYLAVYGTQKFITAFTGARHSFLSWTRRIKFTLSNFFFMIRSNNILFFTPTSFVWTLSFSFSD